jgi:hypothetical protein
MYRVIQKLDGTFLELCRIQDGTERHIHETRQAAIDGLILGAKVMNGTVITAADVKFGKEVQIVKTEVVWEQPKKSCCNCKCS